MLQRPPAPAPRSVPRRPAALWIWYRGDAFRGFQRQPQGPTVQQALQEALASLGLPQGLMPSGRTDRGVHARMQVVSLRLPTDLDLEALPLRLNAVLPGSVGVVRAVWAPKGFHAQWSALGKAYHYRLAPHGLPPGWEGAAWDPSGEPRLQGARLDLERLEALLSLACGTRDFSAFHESSSKAKPRQLHAATLHASADGQLWEIRLKGDGFGRYMVRYLVGSAIAVAADRLAEADFRAALESAHPLAGLKAPGEGLILWEVHYPADRQPFAPDTGDGVPTHPPFRFGG